jgi:hypothetical protein
MLKQLFDGQPFHLSKDASDDPQDYVDRSNVLCRIAKTFGYNTLRDVTDDPYTKSDLIDNCVLVRDEKGLFQQSITTRFPTSKDLVDILIEMLVDRQPSYVSVELNKDYTADVYKDRVVVGCQTVDINVWQRVLDAAKELK